MWSAVTVSLFSWIFLSSLRESAVFTLFQARDLARAAHTAQGALYFWGPEATGGGNLPGGFYYWLSSMPFLLGGDWSNVWDLMAISDALAAGLLWWHLSKKGFVPAVLGVAFLLSSRVHLQMLKAFWNPSFIPPMAILVLVLLEQAYSRGRNWKAFWFFAMLVAGLMLQIHFSSAPLLIGILALQIWSDRVGVKAIPRREWWIGVGIYLLTLVPYCLWALFSIGENPPEGVGQSLRSLSGVWGNPANLLTGEGALANMIQRIGVGAVNLLPLAMWILMGIAFIGGTWSWPSKFSKIPWILAAPLIFPALYYFFLPFGARYALTFLVLMLVGSAEFLAAGWEKWPRRIFLVPVGMISYTCYSDWASGRFAALPTVLLLFILAAVCAEIVRRKSASTREAVLVFTFLSAVAVNASDPSYSGLGQSRLPTWSEVTAASTFIKSRTGWSFDEARRKIHLVNIHREFDMSWLYSSAPRAESIKSTADGFLVFAPAHVGETSEELIRLITQRDAPDEFVEGFASGELEATESVVFEDLAVVGFRWKNPKSRMISFHNVGFSREPSPEDLEVRTWNVGEVRPRDGSVGFVWNACPGSPEFAKSGIVAAKLEDGRLRVMVAGRTLSQPTPWTIPNCTQGLAKPSLSIRCGDSTFKQIEIANNIGLNYIEPPLAARTFLTPYIREFEAPCRDWRVAEIRSGKILTFDNGKIQEAEARSLSVLK